ncbi:CopD family protein [Komagataeibacter intermedius]|uniref:Copper resistance protein D domain-containing protein n=1 Tax=Komagataeibacter intermedius AF2 TaxID=1458464 RepID=A0A0N0MEW3_9PROT|nr:CopD family protein [Komagataeibacter intermedius]KPH86863.1 hypothetical protein GLUCOINTEAF2_0202497 [Komagataeibacter intermedius AF2]
MTPDAFLILCRAARDSLALFLTGSLLFAGWLAPRELGNALSARLGKFWAWGSVFTTVIVVATLPAEVSEVGDGWQDAFSPTLSKAVLVDTTIGQAWIIQAVAGVCLILLTWRKCGAVLSVIPACVLLTATALTGHVRMIGVGAMFFQAVHLLAGGFWCGGLIPVAMLVSDTRKKKWDCSMQVALARYSAAGHIAVLLVLLTGSGLGLNILGGWPKHVTVYSTLLILKLGLTSGMICIACVNRYVYVKNLRQKRNITTNLEYLQRGTIAEIAFAVAVIAIVAVAGRMDPTTLSLPTN